MRGGVIGSLMKRILARCVLICWSLVSRVVSLLPLVVRRWWCELLTNAQRAGLTEGLEGLKGHRCVN